MAKKITILGGSESGVGAALLAKKQGFDVFLSDKGNIPEKYEEILVRNDIHFEETKHTEDLVLASDEIIKSPGIPNNAPILQEARKKGISIVSEIEFASRYTKAKIIAITGSNGKTTTTMLVYHILKSAGFSVGIGGNIGDSFAKQLTEQDYDYWVLEISSFQLDDCYNFSPYISIILNITPDHLDRYDYSFESYTQAKFRMIQNLKPTDYFIYFEENEPITTEIAQKLTAGNPLKGTLLPVSLEKSIEKGAFLDKNDLIFKINDKHIRLSLDEINLKGKHNAINVMCATLASLILGVDEQLLHQYYNNFKGVEHRLEEVEVIDGVRFINDSKATNVDSVFYALDSFKENIIWIAGGVDKGNDYEKLVPLVKQKVKALICLGRENAKIVDFFRDIVPILYQTEDVRDAAEQGFELGIKNEIVLLSPACASFDLFENYEDRGNQFKKAVQKISKINALKPK